MKLKTIHCSTPALKGFTLSTRPCSTATEQLKEVCFNPCLNREWGDLPRNGGKGKSLRSQKRTVHEGIGDKQRVTESVLPPKYSQETASISGTDRHQLRMQQASFSQLPHQSAFLISMQCINKCRAGLVFSIFSHVPLPGNSASDALSLITALYKVWL